MRSLFAKEGRRPVSGMDSVTGQTLAMNDPPQIQRLHKELAQASQLFEEKIRDLSIARRVGDSLKYARDVRRVFETIIDTILEEVNAENCSLMLLNRETGELTVKAARGQADIAVSYYRIPDGSRRGFRLGEGIAGWVAQHGQPISIPDASQDSRFVSSPQSISPIGSLLCQPLIVEDGVVGVVNLSHPRPHAFTAEDERLMAIVADQVAVTLNSVQIFDEMQHLNEALEAEVNRATEELRRANSELKTEITERQRVEEALRESEERFRIILEHAHDGINICEREMVPTPDGKFYTKRRLVFCNDRFLEMSGRSREELMATDNINQFVVSHLSPEERDDNIRNIRQGLPYFGVSSWKRPDGKENYHEWVGVPLRIKGKLYTIGIDRDITERKRAEEALRKAHEELERRVQERTTELSKANAILKEQVVERERAEEAMRESNRRLEEALAELRQTQQQIIQQERLRALGQMASGIAHDFNNALSPIVGFSELLLISPESLGDKEKAHHYLRSIHTAAQDAAGVVKRLQEFYRRRDERESLLPVNLNRLVKQVVSLTQPKWRDQALANGITVDVETDLQKVPSVAGDEVGLREALTNLIFNAVDAMPQDGTITLRTLPGDGHVVLEVSDTGAGMTEEVRQRCLEPFFTTKGERGTGMGLAMVYGIVQRHKGQIDIQSEPGEGTTFTIRLPLMAERRTEKGPQEEEVRSQALHVLVVDDDPVICELVTEYLASDGHTAEVATSGREGLEKLRGGRFDLVVTDRAMPEMSGDQMAATAKQIAPDVPVVMLTGFGDMMQASGEKPGDVDFIVGKPVTQVKLRAVLAKVKAQEATG